MLAGRIDIQTHIQQGFSCVFLSSLCRCFWFDFRMDVVTSLAGRERFKTLHMNVSCCSCGNNRVCRSVLLARNCRFMPIVGPGCSAPTLQADRHQPLTPVVLTTLLMTDFLLVVEPHSNVSVAAGAACSRRTALATLSCSTVFSSLDSFEILRNTVAGACRLLF